MSTTEPALPRTDAEIRSLGWRYGEQHDQSTPAMRRWLEAMGRRVHLAGQQDPEPLDAA